MEHHEKVQRPGQHNGVYRYGVSLANGKITSMQKHVSIRHWKGVGMCIG
jgi:hypothetical protein